MNKKRAILALAWNVLLRGAARKSSLALRTVAVLLPK